VNQEFQFESSRIYSNKFYLQIKLNKFSTGFRRNTLIPFKDSGNDFTRESNLSSRLDQSAYNSFKFSFSLKLICFHLLFYITTAISSNLIHF